MMRVGTPTAKWEPTLCPETPLHDHAIHTAAQPKGRGPAPLRCVPAPQWVAAHCHVWCSRCLPQRLRPSARTSAQPGAYHHAPLGAVPDVVTQGWGSSSKLLVRRPRLSYTRVVLQLVGTVSSGYSLHPVQRARPGCSSQVDLRPAASSASHVDWQQQQPPVSLAG